MCVVDLKSTKMCFAVESTRNILQTVKLSWNSEHVTGASWAVASAHTVLRMQSVKDTDNEHSLINQ